MKKLLLINPWAVNNDGYYTRGFLNGLKNKIDITVATNHYFKAFDDNLKVERVFFKYSEKMKRGTFRKIIRGLEYIKAYIDILKSVKKNKYDIVHIHWLLFYKIDAYFLKLLKKTVPQIVLTAHNVIPHCDGESFLSQLNDIYNIVDDILVHGDAIKQEFIHYFPKYENKVKIQYHGTYFNQDIRYNESQIDTAITSKINSYKKVFVMIGAQFFNKGTDRLIKAWLNTASESKESLLVVAGALNNSYPELDELRPCIKNTENILLLDYFVDDNTANYLLTKSDCVIIPYRHASMSGVVFTASEFSKTVICTKTGALYEYLENMTDSFICENDDEIFEMQLKKVINEYNKEQLVDMGKILNKNIQDKYSWSRIGDFLIDEIYRKDGIS